MIDEIQVENLALIREATLEPALGLTVLTGETGAGTSVASRINARFSTWISSIIAHPSHLDRS